MKYVIFIIFCVFSIEGFSQAYKLYYGSRDLNFTGTKIQCENEVIRRCNNERQKKLGSNTDHVSVTLANKYIANYKSNFKLVKVNKTNTNSNSNNRQVGGSGKQNNEYRPRTNTSTGGNYVTNRNTRVNSSAGSQLGEALGGLLGNLLFPQNNDNSNSNEAELLAKIQREEKFQEDVNDLKYKLRGNDQNGVSGLKIRTGEPQKELTLRNPVVIVSDKKAAEDMDEKRLYDTWVAQNQNNIWNEDSNNRIQVLYADLNEIEIVKMALDIKTGVEKNTKLIREYLDFVGVPNEMQLKSIEQLKSQANSIVEGDLSINPPKYDAIDHHKIKTINIVSNAFVGNNEPAKKELFGTIKVKAIEVAENLSSKYTRVKPLFDYPDRVDGFGKGIFSSILRQSNDGDYEKTWKDLGGHSRKWITYSRDEINKRK